MGGPKRGLPPCSCEVLDLSDTALADELKQMKAKAESLQQ